MNGLKDGHNVLIKGNVRLKIDKRHHKIDKSIPSNVDF